MDEHLGAARAPDRGRVIGLWAVALLFALVYYPAVRWLIHRWSLGVWFHTHGFLVFPIALWLARDRLREVASLPPDASRWGFAFLVPAVLLQVLDAALHFEILSAVSFIVAVPGLCLLFLGRRRTKVIWFPLAFLVFAVPVPLFIVSRVHLVLRHLSAGGTAGVMSFLKYDVEREGTWLRVGPDTFQVADACSGFSTLMALLMASILLTYLSRSKPWRTVLIVALTFPIALCASIFRCISLCMVVAAWDRELLNTIVHPGSGFVAFLLALGLLFLVERWLPSPKPKLEGAAS